MASNLSYFTIEDQFKAPDFSGVLLASSWSNEAEVEFALEEAAARASVPISGFRVGALAVGTSGRAYIGANMEFSGVPLSTTLHAEQSAVVNAWMHGEAGIEFLHVSETPCGYCLQFLQELGNTDELSIFVAGDAKSLSDLLPKPFILAPGHSAGLLGTEEQDLVDVRPTGDLLSQIAVNAARHSYTPYTGSAEGFVIETINGHHFAGRGMESGALNPSIPAAVVALNQKNLSAYREETISRSIHSKLATAASHTYALSKAILRCMSATDVECRQLEEE